ncbi:Hypothetical Protein FCC1311_061742 [Hondaea fermentalgiana]|uniref:Uncharacterized protein n=1 Tax=Hondaea fermentalgiana TaxID=2315210 RepID=A0A2R5GPY7_9STRA|nr:Hypothetical Protein FCC1311_061742 [Hondaea fermentalgiana]|eukprot:GBG29954.1 Hypothetical Protein FCC1311_061742 [Hondaea fermentalgiana]
MTVSGSHNVQTNQQQDHVEEEFDDSGNAAQDAMPDLFDLDIDGPLHAPVSQHPHLKHIKEVSIQFDNAGYYRSLLFLLGVGLLNGVCGITVKRMIKSPVQRGKSLLDAHFGQVSAKFTSFCRQGNDIATPDAIFEALKADGGIPNTITHLVDFNREAGTWAHDLRSLADRKDVRAMLMPTGRVMDAFFSDVQLDFESPTNAAMTVETFEYSGHAKDLPRYRKSSRDEAAAPNLEVSLEERGVPRAHTLAYRFSRLAG